MLSLSHLCWWEQVYDVTKFMEDHPGGDEVLLSSTGIAQTMAIRSFFKSF
jgi:cytochrome b involved in lipid metabolism